ncbi:membrane protein insertion efficiency factor YidD [Persephonella atlantica]|uniref:Putative membrane protein insertion efficiency factor n=1 Tax=Persephonella atlantica TaxID=2699429 RepID=A0ABS1GKK3_9AQUI|nr:membrane protein insertion efficiency factor YidD [Persephonella atlantica]MBK3333351.1 membrane protein insertion efficiency factor YidD [Persephonella atlantica]
MLKKAVIKLLKMYQKFISPLYPASCRYYPTCSQYSIEAVEKYGVFIGILKTAWRVIRCNPLSKGGIDKP